MFNIRQLRILLDIHCCLVTKLCPALCDPIDCSLGFPWWLSSKEFMGNTAARGDTGSTPGLGRSPGGGHGKPLQYSCLGNAMGRGAWWATVHGVAESDMTEVAEHTHKQKRVETWQGRQSVCLKPSVQRAQSSS